MPPGRVPAPVAPPPRRCPVPAAPGARGEQEPAAVPAGLSLAWESVSGWRSWSCRSRGSRPEPERQRWGGDRDQEGGTGRTGHRGHPRLAARPHSRPAGDTDRPRGCSERQDSQTASPNPFPGSPTFPVVLDTGREQLENKYLYSLEHRVLMLLIKKKITISSKPLLLSPPQICLVLGCPWPYTPCRSSCLSHSPRTSEEFSF